MAAIGSLVFCTACGNLLESSSGEKKSLIMCGICGTENKDTSSTTITSKSKASAFPSALRSKRSAVQTLTAEDVRTMAKIKETCPECGHDEATYQTQQLRSADEGSTVFYTCVECGYKFSTNN